ncbi:MAG: hypothetical protein BWZ04_03124 [Firmicutes bacterium ADurb.BinA205]|nr:MAG: hypothetical protein BWZ04_03124 [Firmicutes bacterium ADurb.BinA205]
MEIYLWINVISKLLACCLIEDCFRLEFVLGSDGIKVFLDKRSGVLDIHNTC